MTAIVPAFAQQTIVCIAPGEKVVHGKAVDDWSDTAVTKVTVPGCSVQPTQGSDNTDRRDAQLVQWTAFIYDLAVGAVLAAGGFRRVRYAGIDLKIVGTPLPHLNGMASDHWQLNLSAWVEG